MVPHFGRRPFERCALSRRFRGSTPVANVITTALVLLAPTTHALDDGLAPTPPMGWNSWGHFRCDINEQIVRETAGAMATNGMRDAGYQYVIVDDCWQFARDADGNILHDPERFPSGMQALADHIHGLGLKFGLYSCAGYKTCQGRPGSRGHQFQDARQYARWGIDYLKYDWCDDGGQNARAAYTTMRDALHATGRPIVFHICEWGKNEPWRWGRAIGHMWRTAPDVLDAWEVPSPQEGLGIVQILDRQAGLEKAAGPGQWNDPDMLMAGNANLTIEQYRAQFSLWCILAAPLIAGCDVRQLDAQTLALLTNREAIAIDQDPLGKQGRRVRDDGDAEVWARELHDGARAVALLNRAEIPAGIAIRWEEIGLPGNRAARIRDLWRHTDLGEFRGHFSADVPPRAAAFLRITP